MLDRVASVALAGLLAACAVVTEPAPEPVRFAPSFAGAAGLARGVAAEAGWWRLLDDATLSALVERALEANTDVRIALERLERSRAEVRGARAGAFPGGGASAAVRRSRLSALEAAALPAPREHATRYEAGFDASWELDLFGRVARRVDAASAGLAAGQARLEQARLSVAAEVARVYFELASALERRELAAQALERQRSTARVVEARVRAGFADAVDLRRALADLRLAEAAGPEVEAELADAMARLALLLGEHATGFVLPGPVAEGGFRLVPVAIGEPSKLLATRPDLREAQARIIGARAYAESVRSEFFPRLVITGFIGFVSGGLSGLGAASSSSWAIAPRLAAPVFDVPRIQARLDAARSDQREAMLVLQGKVLAAVAEVEAALARYSQGQLRLEALRSRAAEAAAASALAATRYAAGAADLIELLDAERVHSQSKVELSRAVALQRVAVISVFKAFGTAWRSRA